MNQEQLHYRVTGDAKGFKGAINQSQKSLNGFQQQIKGAASSLKLLFVGGLTIAGTQAVRSAKQFDQSMTRIKSLVGVAGDEVDKMGVAAIEMATNTGRSANEAAEALFFITSAGLRGKEAMEVLEASLKAAAIGLGETKIVADLATSALNAYGAENLSATGATDVLVTSVREGKLEADELAQSMGRVLPLASAMGVEFHEVGAAFAALSRTGTNAAEAATQVRGILSALLKPTQQAEEALAEMGLSSAELRMQLKEKGLLSTLNTLKNEFEGNDEAAAQVFGNVRALSGVLDLMGANAEGTAKIFDSLTRSLNATNTAAEINAESISFQLDAAFAKLRNKTLPPSQKALLAFTNFLNGTIRAFEILGQVGGPQDEFRRELKKTTLAIDEFKISGKEATKEMKDLFSQGAVLGFLGVETENQDLDLLARTILANQGVEPTKTKGFDTLLEFNKKFGTSFKELAEITNEVQFELFMANDKANLLKTTFKELGEGVAENKFELLEYRTAVGEVSRTQEQFARIANAVTFGMNLFFDAISNPEGFNSFIKGIQRIIAQLLKQLAVMVAISAVASALGFGSFKSVFGMISGFGGGGGRSRGGGGLLSGVMPFAKGGIVTSPVTGLVGEQGAEAIIPLSRLPQILNNTSQKTKGEFTLRGQDLILALERAGDFRARVTG